MLPHWPGRRYVVPPLLELELLELEDPVDDPLLELELLELDDPVDDPLLEFELLDALLELPLLELEVLLELDAVDAAGG